MRSSPAPPLVAHTRVQWDIGAIEGNPMPIPVQPFSSILLSPHIPCCPLQVHLSKATRFSAGLRTTRPKWASRTILMVSHAGEGRAASHSLSLPARSPLTCSLLTTQPATHCPPPCPFPTPPVPRRRTCRALPPRIAFKPSLSPSAASMHPSHADDPLSLTVITSLP